MLAVDKRLFEQKLDARLILSVHDELLLEVRSSEAQSGDETGEVMSAVRTLLAEAMTTAAGDRMPDVTLVVAMYEGADWKEISMQKQRL